MSVPVRARRLFAIAIAIAAALSLPACGKKAEEPAAEGEQSARKLPAAPVVKDGKGPYVLRYFSPTSGDLIVAREVSAVPEAARKQVLVVPEDPALQGPWLFVADLGEKQGEQYAVRVVDRFELEKQRAEAAPQRPHAGRTAASAAAEGAALQAGAGGEVILYKTAWCGYCKKAGEYLRLKGVQYVEKDIERDPGARQDMLARAQKAGVPQSQLGGVPILYIKGRVLTGFNRQAIDAALGG